VEKKQKNIRIPEKTGKIWRCLKSIIWTATISYNFENKQAMK
jgi:hypothetical protein